MYRDNIDLIRCTKFRIEQWVAKDVYMYGVGRKEKSQAWKGKMIFISPMGAGGLTHFVKRDQDFGYG